MEVTIICAIEYYYVQNFTLQKPKTKVIQCLVAKLPILNSSVQFDIAPIFINFLLNILQLDKIYFSVYITLMV